MIYTFLKGSALKVRNLAFTGSPSTPFPYIETLRFGDLLPRLPKNEKGYLNLVVLHLANEETINKCKIIKTKRETVYEQSLFLRIPLSDYNHQNL